MPQAEKKRTGEFLIEKGYINERELRDALLEQKKTNERLGKTLIKLGYISGSEYAEALENRYGLPRASLSKYPLDPELKNYVPENTARNHQLVPMVLEEGVLKIAMIDPSDIVALDEVRLAAGDDIQLRRYIAPLDEIEQAIEQLYSMGNIRVEDDFKELLRELPSESNEVELDDLRKMIEDAPIIRLSSIIIEQGIKEQASDIHIESQKDSVNVRYRIDGVLSKSIVLPKNSQYALISRIKIMADLDIAERRLPQDGRIEVKYFGEEIDIRVSTLPTYYGEKVVMRLLFKGSGLMELKDIGFSDQNEEFFRRIISSPHGILLLTGPTGSGKSTTLFAALQELNSKEKNITTVEDPIEYQLPGINQVQARPNINMNFARALRAILRQDPDIIMVGEMRDSETARIAVRAALTGHLVLSTLHTNDAANSVTRLIDMGVEPFLVASSVNGIVSQRLVRRLCPDCKEAYEPDKEELNFLNLEDDNSTVLYTNNGCSQCSHTGYSGRIAVHEMLIIDEEIKVLISNGENAEKIRKVADKKGFTRLIDDGVKKVKEGITCIEEINRLLF